METAGAERKSAAKKSVLAAAAAAAAAGAAFVAAGAGAEGCVAVGADDDDDEVWVGRLGASSKLAKLPFDVLWPANIGWERKVKKNEQMHK